MTKLSAKNKKHILIFDPIAFSGGSKKAITNIIKLLPDENVDITIASSNPSDWHEVLSTSCKVIKIYEFKKIAQAEMGLLYFIRHYLLSLQLLVIGMFKTRFTQVIGTSGPGVDLALYLFNKVHKYHLTQFIQGPVAVSKTIARCLLRANKLCYLPSTKSSISGCLTNLINHSNDERLAAKATSLLAQSHVFELHNGIVKQDWPTQVVKAEQSHDIFWAASLLEWKGLSLLIDALTLFDDKHKPFTSICYIRPVNSQLAITKAPQNLLNVNWHEQPDNLDSIRKNHKIFVSTSVKEPFGLSVLEALAAGLVVVIPADNAYWDQTLVHGEQCYKYQANNALDLKNTLELLLASPSLVAHISKEGIDFAHQYRAEETYAHAVSAIISAEITDVKTVQTRVKVH